MKTTFTKEEIQLMDNAIKNIASDMRELYKLGSLDEIRVDFSTKENGKDYSYALYLMKKSIVVYNGGYKYICFEKVLPNGKSTYPKIKDKDKVFEFEFLKGYEDIRRNIIKTIKQEAKNKEEGIAKIAALNNKYSKEVVLQIEAPETLNQSSIIVTNENGLNTGYIKIGSTSIKIFASNNVKIVGNEPQKTKVKRKEG